MKEKRKIQKGVNDKKERKHKGKAKYKWSRINVEKYNNH